MTGGTAKRFVASVSAAGAFMFGAGEAAATMPGDNGVIAFEGKTQDGGDFVGITSLRGRIEGFARDAMQPAFSRSGNLIAYIDTSADRQDLAVMRANGTRQQVVLRTPEKEWDPAWAPGNRLIYSQGPLRKVRPGENTEPPRLRQLRFVGRRDSGLGQVGWLPDVDVDGNLAYAAGGRECTGKQAIFTLAGPNFTGTATELVPGRCENRFDPSWSPTIYEIAYGSYPASPFASGAEIFAMPSDPPVFETQLTNVGMRAEHPSWSPNGRMIVFSARNGQRQAGLFVWRKSTGRVEAIPGTARAEAANPSWQSR